MDDREMLELAAKAAGIKLNRWNDAQQAYRLDRDDGGWWNPLTMNHDAFDLMVKLGIDIEWRNDGRIAAYQHSNPNGYCANAIESSREDKEANARRAIVLVAAAIGKEGK